MHGALPQPGIHPGYQNVLVPKGPSAQIITRYLRQTISTIPNMKLSLSYVWEFGPLGNLGNFRVCSQPGVDRV